MTSGYDPTSRPSNQVGTASIAYDNQTWLFYYETNLELYVLKSGQGAQFTRTKIVDGDGKGFKANDTAHPLAAVTGVPSGLRVYFVEYGTNSWRELLTGDGETWRVNTTSFNRDGKLKVGLPATLSATRTETELKVFISVSGTTPQITLANHVTGAGPWTYDTITVKP